MMKPLSYLLSLMLVVAASILGIRLSAIPARQNSVPPDANMNSSFAAYDTFGPGWETTLLLNNTTGSAIVANPIVYATDGSRAPLPSVQLEAHEHRRVSFDQWVAPLGDNFKKGSLELDYQGPRMGLGAIISSVNLKHSLAVEVVLHAKMEFKSPRMEGIWYRPNHKGLVTLAVLNITDQTVNAAVSSDARQGENRTEEHQVSLAPHQSRFLDVDELTGETERRSGAISIHYDGPAGAVLAQGFVLEPESGFSYNIPFADPTTFGDTKFSGAGILLGKQGSASARQEFTGRLLLRNISDAPLRATPALQRGAAISSLGSFTLQPGELRVVRVDADSAPGGQGAMGLEVSFTGKPGDLVAQWMSVDQTGSLVVETPLRGSSPKEHFGGSNPFYLAGDFTSVTYIKNTGEQAGHVLAYIQHDGGQYMIGLKSVNPGETLAIDIRALRDEQAPDERGMRLPADLLMGQINWRWHDGPAIVGRTNVMSESAGIAGNRSCPSCNCTPYSVTFSLPAGNQTLAAGGTFTFQVQETDTGCDGSSRFNTLGAGGLPWSSSNPQVATVDGAGNVTAVSAGTTTISTSGTVDRQTTPVGTFPCGFTGCHESPCGIVAFPVSAQAQVAVKPRIDSISPAKGLIGATTSGVTISGKGLNGATVNGGTGITATVKSSNDTTLTVDLAVASNATAGNHSISVSAGGQTSNSVNFFVQVPTSLKFVSVTVLPDGPAPPSGCPGSANYGIRIDIKYQVQDQQSPSVTIQSASMTPHEKGTFFTGGNFDSNIGPVKDYPTSSMNTASDGTFHDVPFGLCNPTPINMPLTATQNITMILPSGTAYPVRSQSFSLSAPNATSFGHGTIQNTITSPGTGSDISASR
jgi:hypothetical protein